ncbi:uncharacterized protein LOC111597462 [Drosophila hydei]|uniref:Uncharacterized protein LOC111597462 n=1 Tax=Drosophila hydei TaxID=7224 RepID=A0A6J1LVL3_DROHY|nr:uncharacterized protein LOC111597462 [Drosophila hydei]
MNVEGMKCDENLAAYRETLLNSKRVLYWCRRLNLMPDEVQKLSPQQIKSRKLLVQQAEELEELRRKQFKRWQNLNELRWLMYEEQRKYNVKCGQQATDTSIWQILSLAQYELEKELDMPSLRGDCPRFPSPMSVAYTNRESDSTNNVLKPLTPVIMGLSESQNIQLSEEKLTTLASNQLSAEGLTPLADRQLLADELTRIESGQFPQVWIEELRRLASKQLTSVRNQKFLSQMASSLRHSKSSNRDTANKNASLTNDELVGIRLQLKEIKKSTRNCDMMVDMLFAEYIKPISQFSSRLGFNKTNYCDCDSEEDNNTSAFEIERKCEGTESDSDLINTEYDRYSD